ncbi:hypothetical protein [Bradyrhizobium sp.]|uniref:hypothetical protein n=1 Tax=Bradyrhizobium sp. TaxID=376 RepID=UPI003C6F14FC
MASYKVALVNIFGELDCRVVHQRDDIQPATLSLVSSLPYLSPGDKIEVVEIDAATGERMPRR